MTHSTEEMQGLGTSDYMGSAHWRSATAEEDPEESYPFVSRCGRALAIYRTCDDADSSALSLCTSQPLVLKKRGNSISSGMASGQTTPGGGPNGTATAGRQKTLSEGDLARADAALMSNGHA